MYVCWTVSYFFVTVKPGVAGWRLKPAQRGSKRRGFCEGGRFPQLPTNYYLLPTCKFATLIYQILGLEMSVRAPPLLSPYVFVQLPAVYLLLLTCTFTSFKCQMLVSVMSKQAWPRLSTYAFVLLPTFIHLYLTSYAYFLLLNFYL